MKPSPEKTIRMKAANSLLNSFLTALAIIILAYFLKDQAWLPAGTGDDLTFKFFLIWGLFLYMDRDRIKEVITGKEKK